MSSPRQNIFLIGFMGAGKSSTGRRMSRQLRMDFHDLDKHIEAAAGMQIPQIFEELGEPEFRRIESECLRHERREPYLLSTGGGTPCFNDNMDWMKSRGLTIYLELSVASLYHRIVQSHAERPLMMGISREEMRLRIEKLLAARTPYYEQAEIRFNPVRSDFRELLKLIREHGIR